MEYLIAKIKMAKCFEGSFNNNSIITFQHILILGSSRLCFQAFKKSGPWWTVTVLFKEMAFLLAVQQIMPTPKHVKTLLNSLQQSLLFQYVQHLPTLQEKGKRRQTYQKREAKKPFISISKMFQQWRQLYDRIGVKNSELAVCLLDR